MVESWKIMRLYQGATMTKKEYELIVEWVEKQSIRVVYDNELQGQDVWRQTNAVNKKSLLTFLKGLIDEV